MNLREYFINFKKYRGPYKARDFALGFAFLVVFLVFPILVHYIGIFALIYLAFVVVPMYYATMHMLNLRRSETISKREFKILFLQGYRKPIRKTFQVLRTWLWSILVFLGSAFVIGFIVGLTIQPGSPILTVFDQIAELLMKYGQQQATIEEIYEYFLSQQTILFPFIFVTSGIPMVLAFIFFAFRFYRQAFFTFYASNFVITSYSQVELGMLRSYPKFAKQHRQMILIHLALPLLVFLVVFIGLTFLFYYLEITDINLTFLFATIGGLVALFPLYPYLFYGNGFMYEEFSKQNYLPIGLSLIESAKMALSLPELSPHQRAMIEKMIQDVEFLIQNRQEVNESKADQPDGE